MAYKSIREIPAYNWFMLGETNNLYFLLKKSTSDIGDEPEQIASKELSDLYYSLIDEFNQHFGDSEISVLTQMKIEYYEGLIKRCNKQLNSGQKNVLNILKRDIEDLEKPKEVDYWGELAEVEELIKMPLNDREITVFKYYTHIKRLNKKALKQKENGRATN